MRPTKASKVQALWEDRWGAISKLNTNTAQTLGLCIAKQMEPCIVRRINHREHRPKRWTDAAEY